MKLAVPELYNKVSKSNEAQNQIGLKAHPWPKVSRDPTPTPPTIRPPNCGLNEPWNLAVSSGQLATGRQKCGQGCIGHGFGPPGPRLLHGWHGASTTNPPLPANANVAAGFMVEAGGTTLCMMYVMHPSLNLSIYRIKIHQNIWKKTKNGKWTPKPPPYPIFMK